MHYRPALPLADLRQRHASGVLKSLIQDPEEMQQVTEVITARIAPARLSNLTRHNGYVTFSAAKPTFEYEDAIAIAPIMKNYLGVLLDTVELNQLDEKETEVAYMILFAIAQVASPTDREDYENLIEVLAEHYGSMHAKYFTFNDEPHYAATTSTNNPTLRQR